MIIARIPGLLSRTFRSLTWNLPNGDNTVYLTFDDGPTPVVTEWVLETLDQFGARATFFCLGNNVTRHPGIYSKILDKGHAVGNHSFSHVKGFRTPTRAYLDDIRKASGVIRSDLFRPPYGRILPWQVKRVKEEYNIVMWSVLSVDYNQKISGEQVVRNVVRNIRPGSIIVFHDSVKASRNLYFALPRVLEDIREKGYRTDAIGS